MDTFRVVIIWETRPPRVLDSTPCGTISIYDPDLRSAFHRPSQEEVSLTFQLESRRLLLLRRCVTSPISDQGRSIALPPQ
jgi:hypothetical protein